MIKNRRQLLAEPLSREVRKVRRDVCDILEATLTAIDPQTLTHANLKRQGTKLKIAGMLSLDLARYHRVFLVGAGKAVYKMALAVEEILGDRLTTGHINIPTRPKSNKLRHTTIQIARHPTPDASGVRGSKKIKHLLENAQADDLIIAVISGGGSSLMPLPTPDITLKDKITVTSLLLKTPAVVHEINIVRKHLSQIKGGQFAGYAYPATLVALYISDVIDDPLDIQASGPTTPDPSTFGDAVKILKKYDIWSKTPAAVRRRFTRGVAGLVRETPTAKHEVFRKNKIHNFTIANHALTVRAAISAGRRLGYHCLELTSSLQGEAREVAKMLCAIGKHCARHQKPIPKPALIVAGGETTVHVTGTGKGGRNQELALASLPYLQTGMTIVSFGTDGVDGITPISVAGALVDSSILVAARQKKLDPAFFLHANDSYHFFKNLKGHIITGHTGTNVGDLMLVIVI